MTEQTKRRSLPTRSSTSESSQRLSDLKELKDLQAERLGRRRARTDVLTYASTISIPGVPVHPTNDDCEEFRAVRGKFGAHHHLWLGALQKVQDGEIRRLMGLMPPGTAKSTYTSVVFPTHCMGRFPGTLYITTSYGSELPRKFGRRARSIVKQKMFERIFGATLSPESSAADEWALTNGSEWMGAGILAGITGNRADGVVWDDLIKGRENAESQTFRDKTWDTYFDDLLSRKKPNAWEIGVTTRWHEDDVAGRILPDQYDGRSGWMHCRDGNDWFVVCLPAEAERADDPLGRQPGERIWPEWFPVDHFAPFKLNTRSWSSLYQQRPSPGEGLYFLKDWLVPYSSSRFMRADGALTEPARETMHVYGASDYAVTADGGDYTVHVVVGIDSEGNLWLLDLWRGQSASDVWVERWCDLVEVWKPLGWAEEKGQIIGGVGPFLAKRARERKAYCARKGFPSKADKVTRAQSIIGRMAMHGLRVPVNAPWYPAFERELLAFNAGTNDDQVDAMSLIGQVLDIVVAGQKVEEDEELKIVSTDPEQCTVTLDDIFLANEQRFKAIVSQRIR